MATSYEKLEAAILKAKERRKEMERKAADAVARGIMNEKGVKELLAGLSKDELRAVSQYIGQNTARIVYKLYPDKKPMERSEAPVEAQEPPVQPVAPQQHQGYQQY